MTSQWKKKQTRGDQLEVLAVTQANNDSGPGF